MLNKFSLSNRRTAVLLAAALFFGAVEIMLVLPAVTSAGMLDSEYSAPSSSKSTSNSASKSSSNSSEETSTDNSAKCNNQKNGYESAGSVSRSTVTTSTRSSSSSSGSSGGGESLSSGDDDSGGDSYSCPSGMTLYNNQCYSNELCTTTGSGKGARTSCAFDPLPVTNSCTLDGVTVPPNQSRTFFSQTSVAYGDVCASVGQSRTCTNGTLSGSSVYNHANCAVGIAPPLGTISLDANPHIIRYGGTSRIIWDGGNADSCTVSGTNFSASGVNGSKDATNITEETVYTLTCIKGPYQKSVSTTVRIVPLWQEI